ncbi:MAG: hypothetical protein BGN86_00455 [Caulobacterales bacterium 68-7]|nr:MAG: hypothetical protein BGN86_00455 [Caulobacterales bacterium 68-7]
MSRNHLSGALVLTFGNAVKMLVQFALVPILARMLGPEAYGLAALVMPFILFVNLFADAGLEKAVARSDQSDGAFVSTAFWLSGLLGLGLCLIMAALAGVVLWRDPATAIAPVMLGLLPVLAMSALCAVPNGLVIRSSRLKTFAAADIVSTLVSGVVAIVLAMNHFGVWALVWQQNVLWFLRLTIISCFSGLRPKFVFELRSVSPHLIFAISTLGIGVVEFLARSFDNVLIGWTIGPAALGVYAMGYQLIRAPELLVAGPVYASLFSAFVSNADDPIALAKAYKTAMRAVVQICTPLLAGLALVADLALPPILGAKWAVTIPVVQWLAITGLVLCVWTVIGALLVGIGRPQIQLRSSLWMAATTILGISIGATTRSPVVVAAAVSIAMCIAIGPMLKRAAEVTRTRVVDLFWALRGPIFGAATMAAVTFALRPNLGGLHDLTQLGVLMLANASAYLLVLWAANPEAASEDLRSVNDLLRRRPALA